MEIISMKLKNFKGIKDFTLTPNGENLNIYGDNATGKTTLADAFNWLLFDKDTQGKKDFGIKTLDSNNNPIHFLEHEVEAVIRTDKGITLRKVYEEKWAKKRGSAEKEFEGHTTSYLINGVPMPLKDYNSFINNLLNEDNFKLLTSPSFFNEQLHWQKRREILLQVCGDISDADVIASDAALAKLPSILGDRKLEDHRKVIATRRAELNKEIEKIPTRIDEVMLGLPDISGLETDIISLNLAAKRDTLKFNQEELLQIESGGETAQKQIQLNKIKLEILTLESEQRAKLNDLLSEKRNVISETTHKANSVKLEIATKESEIEANKVRIETHKTDADDLRTKWIEVNAKQFEINQETVCPACGRDLPEEKLAVAREKALADFNQDKAKKLANISASGKQATSEAKEYEAKNAELNDKVIELTKEVTVLWRTVSSLQKEYDELKNTPQNMPAEYVAKTQERDVIAAQISSIKDGNSNGITQAKAGITQIQLEIGTLESQLKLIDDCKKGQLRIKELEAQQKQYAAEYEKLEGELYLTEQFIRTKVSMLESKINSKFKYARFKMFETQINGGITECCETLFDGVPYSSGLNNAARINVGLDIINTLSEHYGFSAPIFVDNREAVTKLAETNAQVISLIVSEQDKKLRVETAKEIKEVA